MGSGERCFLLPVYDCGGAWRLAFLPGRTTRCVGENEKNINNCGGIRWKMRKRPLKRKKER